LRLHRGAHVRLLGAHARELGAHPLDVDGLAALLPGDLLIEVGAAIARLFAPHR